ncbi:2-aminoethanethiol dioxygenase-like [Tubulanus polymorphus]|uniref:2-aminoethanethiol dioxygenase-like n=1 Tax=Tubulanus polymorphus TaxID=672921 RepID=UPI003DA2ADCC
MAALIQKVVKMAQQTFSKHTKGALFQEKITLLSKTMKQVTAADLNFDQELVADPTFYKQTSNFAPVVYVPIWEDEIVSIGIFVLKNGVSLPLHDHPNMHGVCKVIHGTLKVKQYSGAFKSTPHVSTKIPKEITSNFTRLQIQNYIKEVRPSQVCEFNTESEPCLLTPTDGNFHEITSLNGPAAFLDILAPPYDYDKGQVCHYYQEIPIQHQSGQTSDIAWLLEIPQPSEFWCETSSYKGPEILP